MKTTRTSAAIASHPESESRFRSIAIALGLTALVTFGAGQARAESCLDHIVAAEREYNIPKGLLLAVALTESGRGGYPAPFAVNVKGRALYPSSEDAAAKVLRDDRGRLRTNVTAGCMQLSVAHHKASFKPVERIVNPSENVRYAARLLVRLRAEAGNWASAVSRYNGSSGNAARAYQCKVQRQLTALGDGATQLVDPARCKSTAKAEIAPRTRRAFQSGQPVLGGQPTS